VAVSTLHRDGGEGGVDLAEKVVAAVEAETGGLQPVYDPSEDVESKIRAVATEVYGADGVEFTSGARSDLEDVRDLGLDDVPVCISKTPGSLSDDPGKRGVPEDWELTVRELYPSAGAGFVVALTGDVLTMPGLPSEPAAADITVDDEDGSVDGLF
jgi:formate--tetrahydrofolate ligase